MHTSSDQLVRERHWHYDAVFFVALVATGIAFGAALAHALELPNKLSLSRENYFIVQDIYRGWWQLAFVLLIEIVAMITLLVLSRRQRRVFGFVLVALLGVVAAQIVFWIWTYPANAATQNWTVIPENWEMLRRQWEFSHLAGAGFQFVAFCALILAALASRRTENC
jgi:hypothetical protein